MKYIISFCRIVVGSLFIVSGLIKVNDVIGFSYKLEEYFSVKALGFPELLPYVIPIAIFIVVGEVLLGVATLLGAWPKLTSGLILFMTLFFTWLTYYTYTCDPHAIKTFVDVNGQTFQDTPECVTSCGCFGDALKLTPYESFLKDIFLLPFILPFFIAALLNRVKLNTRTDDLIIIPISCVLVAIAGFKIFDWLFPLYFTIIACAVGLAIKHFSKNKQWAMALGVLAVTGYTQYHTYKHLPLKDYRAYAIGQNLRENMKTAQELGKQPPKFLSFFTLVNKAGEQKKVDSETYVSQKIYTDTTWKIVPEKTYTEKVSEGYEPKITDFMAVDADGNDYVDSLLNAPRVFVVVMWNLAETCKHDLNDIAAFAKKAEADGYPVYGLTTAAYDESETFRHEHQLPFPFLSGDEKVLKTMIRANPGVLVLENATVTNMWSGCDTPDYDKSKANQFR